MKRIDLKKLRKDYNLTQIQISRLTGYNQGFLSLVENGKVNAPKAFIEKVTETLGITDIGSYMIREPEDVAEPTKLQKAEPSRPASSSSEDYRIIDRLLTIIEKLNGRIEKLESRLEELDKH